MRSGRRLREKYPDIELHLIGPLQSNKTREAVELFDVIESVDREKIAKALSEEIARTGKRPRLFVQVNTGAEPQKAGVLPESADSFLAACRDAYGLQIEGLMCVPPRGRTGVAAFRAARRHRRAQWNRRTLHGHEFGFRTRDPVRGDLCPRRLGDHGRAGLSRVRRGSTADDAHPPALPRFAGEGVRFGVSSALASRFNAASSSRMPLVSVPSPIRSRLLPTSGSMRKPVSTRCEAGEGQGGGSALFDQQRDLASQPRQKPRHVAGAQVRRSRRWAKDHPWRCERKSRCRDRARVDEDCSP